MMREGSARPGSPLQVTIDDEHATSGANWVLAMVIMTTALTGIALSIMVVTFPAILEDFPGTSPAEISWINNLFTIVSAAVIIPCGVLADRLGRKRMLLAGTALFTVGSVLGALAPSPAWIMVSRTILALGAAAFGPAGMALLVSVFPPQRIVFAISIWSISGGIASSLGPSLGGVLVDEAGWRWAFWINLPLCIVTLALGPFVLRETGRAGARAGRLPDALGVVLVMAATSVVTLGVVQRKTASGWGWHGEKTLLCFAAGVVLTVLFVLRCRHTPHPLVRLELLRDRAVQIGSLGLVVLNVGFFGVYWAFVQHTISQWEWSAARAGVVTAPYSLVSGTAAFLTSRAADRIGPRPFVLAGSAGMLASFAYLWFAIGETESIAAVLIGSTWLGATSGIMVPSLASMTLRGLPRDQHSLGSAFNSMAQRIGATFGTSLAITFVAVGIGTEALHHMVAVGAVALLVTIPLGVLAGREHPSGVFP